MGFESRLEINYKRIKFGLHVKLLFRDHPGEFGISLLSCTHAYTVAQIHLRIGVPILFSDPIQMSPYFLKNLSTNKAIINIPNTVP